MLEDIYGAHIYTFSKVTIAVILTLDGLAMLFSGLNLFIISCLPHEYCQDCTRCCFTCFIFMWFCRKYKYSEDEVDSKAKHQEYRLWLLLASFTAPLVCIGTHSSFVIMAWTSDSEQANSMTVIFILSFIYYFLGFRQLYILFAQGCCVTYTPKKPPTICSFQVLTYLSYHAYHMNTVKIAHAAVLLALFSCGSVESINILKMKLIAKLNTRSTDCGYYWHPLLPPLSVLEHILVL